jgi:hypothetical protein
MIILKIKYTIYKLSTSNFKDKTINLLSRTMII